MNKKLLSIISISVIIAILFGCKSTRELRQQEKEAAIDSTLYFEQVAVSDPFIDSLKQIPDERLSLKKDIYPPAPRTPKGPLFKEVEGYRVQIFAGIDSLNALLLVVQAKDLVPDSVYLLKEKGLFKIQAGDFQFRPQADQSKTLFRQNGFPGAWVLQRSILIPIDTTQIEPDTTQIISNNIIGVPATGKYKIQVFASNSEAKANLTILDVKEINNYNAFYEKSGDLYKVFVGYFKLEQEARKALEDLRKNGFPDAWLVY